MRSLAGRVLPTVALAVGLIAGSTIGLGVSVDAATPASSRLTSVACVSGTNCMAVGSGSDKTLAEHWNGTAWSIVATPNPIGASSSSLLGVSCPAATLCFAVGQQVVAATHAIKTLVERWNGTAWSIVASPNPAGADYSRLLGIACTSKTFCFAVGSQAVSGGPVKTLIERWNGTKWSIAASPNRAGMQNPVLNAVTCTSTLRCVAVGNDFGKTDPLNNFNTFNTLVERWNGTKWSIIASPNPDPAGDGAHLTGVSCLASSNCLAVGDYLIGGFEKPTTLAERWNGTTWSIVATPSPVRSYSSLQGVSCAGKRCMSAGYYDAYGPGPSFTFLGRRTLVEQWTGTSWRIIASPNPSSVRSQLAAVTCTVQSSCFSVGYFSNAQSGPFKTLVERWNGSTWTVVASPNP